MRLRDVGWARQHPSSGEHPAEGAVGPEEQCKSGAFIRCRSGAAIPRARRICMRAFVSGEWLRRRGCVEVVGMIVWRVCGWMVTGSS